MAKPKKKDQPLKLNMPFEDALRKALNTPLPDTEKSPPAPANKSTKKPQKVGFQRR